MILYKRLLFILVTLFAVTAGSAQSHSFSVTNTSDFERKDELVTLKRDDVEKWMGKKKEWFNYQIFSGGAQIVFQAVDTNNDRHWDQLIFVTSLQPNEKKTFTVKSIGAFVADTASSLAHVRMKPIKSDSTFGQSIPFAEMPYQNKPNDFSKNRLPPYLTEGPGWENDKVAFRLYFDTRNTVDIYGKRIPGLVMDTVGANLRSSYHNLSSWGMDILHVVKSLGAGSLAIATQDETGKDTLIRLGGNNIQKETYRQLADGPLYAAFQMNYDWVINAKPVHVKQDITIWAGQYFYESTITATGVPKGSRLVSGIADFYQNTADSFHLAQAAVLLSFGKQSENKDELGMAILVPQRTWSSFSEAPKVNSDVMETHLVAQNIDEGKPLRFRFYSCWSKTDERFKTKEYFVSFMKKEALKFSEPFVVTWK